jgi:hypothetical protein
MYYRSSSRKVGLALACGEGQIPAPAAKARNEGWEYSPPPSLEEEDDLSASSSGSPIIFFMSKDIPSQEMSDYASTDARKLPADGGSIGAVAKGGNGTTKEKSVSTEKTTKSSKKLKQKKKKRKMKMKKWTMQDIIDRMNMLAVSSGLSLTDISFSDQSTPSDPFYRRESRGDLLLTSSIAQASSVKHHSLNTKSDTSSQSSEKHSTIEEESGVSNETMQALRPRIEEKLQYTWATEDKNHVETATRLSSYVTENDQQKQPSDMGTLSSSIRLHRRSARINSTRKETEIVYPRVTVRVSKDAGKSAGITLRRELNDIYIQRISDTSIFRGTSLVPGQQVIAINGKSCWRASPTKLEAYIDKTSDPILTVSRDVSSPTSTVTTLKKPGKSCGIRLRQRKSDRAVVISKISPSGAFFESNLQVGQQVLFINGRSCRNKSAWEASRYLAKDLRYVSITVAIPRPPKPVSSVVLFSLKPQYITCPFCGYQGASKVQDSDCSSDRDPVCVFCVLGCGDSERPDCSVDHYCPQCAECFGSYEGLAM